MSPRLQLVLFLLLTVGSSLLVASTDHGVSPAFDLNLSLPRHDTDADGMVDEWETANGLEVGLNDTDEDADADGRTNIEEYNQGTDPQVAEVWNVARCTSDVFSYLARVHAADTDEDGMPDWWETAHNLPVDSPNANGDADSDGFTDLAEYNAGTDPQVADLPLTAVAASLEFGTGTGASPYGFGTDTDEDGMPDWWEVKYGLNRLVKDGEGDLDHDGLTNLTEYQMGRLPNVDDWWGVAWWISTDFLVDTIGISPDTDGDGMRDWWEIAHGLLYDVPDADGDPDHDGRTNLEEYNAGTDPQVDDWRGPSVFASLDFAADTGGFNGGFSLDSDGDGMPDWWEIKYGLLPSVDDSGGNPDKDALTNIEEYNAGTNPTLFDWIDPILAQSLVFLLDTGGIFLDTDGDGMPDWWERKYFDLTTNAVDILDADGDGLPNFAEYVAGTSPRDGSQTFCVTQCGTLTNETGFVVYWDTVLGRTYSIYAAPTLTQDWTNRVYQVAGDGTRHQVTITETEGARLFVRIRVSYP